MVFGNKKKACLKRKSLKARLYIVSLLLETGRWSDVPYAPKVG